MKSAAARNSSPSKIRSPKEKPPISDRPFSDEPYYTSSIKLYHLNDTGPAIFTGQPLFPLPPKAPIPGFVCKAARLLLDKAQAWLWAESAVSRKTINDFENGFIEPKLVLNNRIRLALEGAGANFVSGESVIGVVVYTKPGAKPKSDQSTSRSAR